MSIYLVRHAKAGSRHDWSGPDEQRPLSKKGRRQADCLVDLLSDKPVTAIVSSPYRRCMETLQPLADKLGLTVEEDPALAESADVADTVALVRRLAPGPAVLCSHGDMIPTLLEALSRTDGLALPDDAPFAKGSTWELRTDGPNVVGARYIAPCDQG